MSLKPLVSVIIASHNHQNYITDCIKSVIKQSYNKIELIVIDDGSTDNSVEILSTLAKKYQFQFIAQKNIGLTQTLNKAFSLAKGEYIAPLGSDDCWLLDKIEKQVEFMQNHQDIAVVAGNILVIDQQGIIIPRQRIYPQRDINFKRLFSDPKSIPAAPTVMIRTSILKQIGGYDTQSNLEDLTLWLKITKAGFMIVILNDILAYYRKHPTNTSKNYQFMTENILKAYAPYHHEKNYQAIKNKVLISQFLKISKKDRNYAWQVFKQISAKYYNTHVLRGLFYLFFGRKK